MKYAAFIIVGALCYLADAVLYNVSVTLNVARYGVVTMLWVLWFSSILLDFRPKEQIMTAAVISLFVFGVSAQGFFETFVPLITMVLIAYVVREHIVLQHPLYRFVWTLLFFFFYIYIRYIALRFQATGAWTFGADSAFWVKFILNAVLYAVFSVKVFAPALARINRRFYAYD